MENSPVCTSNDEETSLLESVAANDTTSKPSLVPCKRWQIVAEPMIVLYCIVGYPMGVISEQVLYQKMGQHLGIDVSNLTDPSTGNTTGGNCGDTSSNDTDYVLREQVQGATSKMDAYMGLIGYPISFIMLLLYGSYSDRIGRKFMFVLAPIGTLYKAGLYLVVVYFDLNVYFLFLTNVEYFFGNMFFLLAAVFAFLADTIDERYLAMRIIIVDVLVHLSASIAYTSIGYWVKSVGFFWPILFVVCGKCLVLLYAIFVIPQTLPRTSITSENCANECPNKKFPLKRIAITPLESLKLFTAGRYADQRKVLIVLLLSLFLSELWRPTGLTTLYQMNYPLCWDALWIGYYNTALLLLNCIGMLTGIVMKKWMHLGWLIVIGRCSNVLQHTLNIFVTNSIMMFLVALAGIMSILPTPITRRVLSSYFSPDKQGSLFALISAVYVLCELLGKVTANNIYAATLHWMETFVFLVAAVFNAVGTLLAVWYVLKLKKTPEQKTSTSINSVSDNSVS